MMLTVLSHYAFFTSLTLHIANARVVDVRTDENVYLSKSLHSVKKMHVR